MKRADLQVGKTYVGMYGTKRSYSPPRTVVEVTSWSDSTARDVVYAITLKDGTKAQHSCFISTFLNWAKGVLEDER